jgi:tRNA1(Val) A37 N6-methylase TrmN6
VSDDELSIDSLTGGWSIAQRVKGHRHSTDDLLTGWYAAENSPPRDDGSPALMLLDLGAGIGSVGLLALWRADPKACLTAIEAQEVSFDLLWSNVERNKLEERVRAIRGDLRTIRLYTEYDLVTGSPPYWDVSQGVLPEDSQKAHARFELRGTVYDYAKAARNHMGRYSRFVLCFPTVQRERCHDALATANLALLKSKDVIPRVGAEPLFTLFCAQLGEAGRPDPIVEPPHIVRDAQGLPTLEHVAARASFGLIDRERPR